MRMRTSQETMPVATTPSKRSRWQHLGTLAILVTSACQAPPQEIDGPSPAASLPADPHSFARPEEVSVAHLELDLTVDFEARTLSGRASLHLANSGTAPRLYLDTDGLEIQSVTFEGGEPAHFILGEGTEALGKPLIIDLVAGAKTVHVDYVTSPSARALQWLEPRQTAGGQHPFLFTQSQAILARTWIPCQDTPQVRMTYEATIHVPPTLLPVMSAENPTEKNSQGIYHFRMEQPIPSYLLALAVGDIAFQAVGERTGVYAEPSVLGPAAEELGDIESMVGAAEEIYGAYQWDRFDVLVLPPSFPFGGMENPRLTFATPTILAGDRSLLALIAHELAHSWSGNLVTNASWNDLWINEGFTVYFERRIMEAIHGRPYAEMLAQLGLEDLEANIEELGEDSPLSHLRFPLTGEQDPDDTFSDIPYEKGYFFLRAIEEAVGRERFDEFLRTYFETFAFQSMDTSAFVHYLRQNLVAGDDSLEAAFQIEAWTDGPGIPSNCPKVNSTAFENVRAQIAAWQGGAPAAGLSLEGWNTHQWLHFLRHLPEPMSLQQMTELDAAFHFTASHNSEILNAWFLQAIRNDYSPAYPALESFLTSMGRRKFLTPLYTALAESEEGRKRALEIYRTARPTYHPLAVGTIDKVLDLSEEAKA